MLLGKDFKKLTDYNEIGYFVDLYEKTPQQFLEYYENELDDYIDLKNKLVISLECNVDDKPVKIIGAYSPYDHHTALLSYHGHIAFIDIKNSKNERIELLAKDDECMPQTFDEWYRESYENYCLEDYDYYNEQYCLDLINTVIQGTMQNLSLNFKKEDIIILQGL